jgi:hypothetical protein
MPAKWIKMHSGVRVEVKSIRLKNGNLLIPRRRADNRKVVELVEVKPGSADYKRWLPVAVDEPDPRVKQ